MPRIPRIIKEEGVFHIISRGNNKQWIFKDDEDFNTFLELLRRHKKERPFHLYHYVLLNNHFHLILESHIGQTISKILQGIKLSYVYHFRRKYNFVGHLFQDRFKSILIQKEKYLLACGAYIELNPVRANVARTPEEYPYSSSGYYLKGRASDIIDPDPYYLALGDDDRARRKRYREIIDEQRKQKESYSIGNYIGTEEYEKEIFKNYGIKRIAGKRGRPRKGF